MTAIGNTAWFALKFEDPDEIAPVSLANQARSRENASLKPQLLVLAPEPGTFVALSCGETASFSSRPPSSGSACVTPLADRLRRRLEFEGKVCRVLTGANQIKSSGGGTQASTVGVS